MKQAKVSCALWKQKCKLCLLLERELQAESLQALLCLNASQVVLSIIENL